MYTAPILYPQSFSTRLLPKTSKFKLVNAHEEFSSLTEEQLKQVYAGVYPTDFPRETIRLKQHSGNIFSCQTNSTVMSPTKPKLSAFTSTEKCQLHPYSTGQQPAPVHESIVKATSHELNDKFLFQKSGKFSFDMDTNLTFHISADGSDISRYNLDFAISSDSRPLFLTLEVGS
ncbi:hypothetical protein AJ78_00299 [Emergomyces pasteurianus Ep9510]|uniref:Uncharacterized protein n=1 Tax=Emergomyces pasteurianus Ep9510 TaxID=1447872 RepID=A0A1J9QUB8_9EURO|nr:hypothetical protein AJ78_00299 [Emergomyces pasteurianus Ep9510]